LKKIGTWTIVVCFISILLFLCYMSLEESDTFKQQSITQTTASAAPIEETSKTGMISIQGQKNLMYREDTKIIYIVYNEDVGIGEARKCYGHTAPYYDINGNLCKYDDGRIVPILKGD